MKKIITLILMFVLCVLLCACGSSSKESPVEDFSYEMNDGEIVITGYIGTDLEIYVPSTINDRPVTAIGESAFEGYDMTHITIPDSVTIIEKGAFYDCTCLTSVEWSDNLKVIDKFAFEGCTSLESISFSNSLERINEGAFSYCGLKKVSLPENLQFLDVDVFDSCDNLSSVKIPDNTEIAISVTEQNAGHVGYITFFESPVGSSYVTTYYDSVTNDAVGNNDYEQLQTTIVVTDGSYAHQQVATFTSCGLTIEVE